MSDIDDCGTLTIVELSNAYTDSLKELDSVIDDCKAYNYKPFVIVPIQIQPSLKLKR